MITPTEVRLAGDMDQELVLTKWSTPDGGVVFRFTVRDIDSEPDDYIAEIDIPIEDVLPLAMALRLQGTPS